MTLFGNQGHVIKDQSLWTLSKVQRTLFPLSPGIKR